MSSPGPVLRGSAQKAFGEVGGIDAFGAVIDEGAGNFESQLSDLTEAIDGDLQGDQGRKASPVGL